MDSGEPGEFLERRVKRILAAEEGLTSWETFPPPAIHTCASFFSSLSLLFFPIFSSVFCDSLTLSFSSFLFSPFYPSLLTLPLFSSL